MKKNRLQRISRRLLWWLIAVILVFGAGLIITDRKQGSAPNDWQVIACDVGQGSATLVRSGATSAVLVDTGPEGANLPGCLRWAGVHSLSAVLLSHDHADHTGNVNTAKEYLHGGTDRVFCTPAMRGHCTHVSAGQHVRVGTADVEVLWPAADQRVEENTNNTSLVMRAHVAAGAQAEHGTQPLTAVLPADAEQPALDRVEWGDDPAVDVLALAHHGSKTSGTQYLRSIHPTVAVASTGKNNSYGHPHRPIVAALERLHTPLFNTATTGHVAFIRNGQDVVTSTEKPSR